MIIQNEETDSESAEADTNAEIVSQKVALI